MNASAAPLFTGESLFAGAEPMVERRTQAQDQRAIWQREMERAETQTWFGQPLQVARPSTEVTKGTQTAGPVHEPVARSIGAVNAGHAEMNDRQMASGSMANQRLAPPGTTGYSVHRTPEVASETHQARKVTAPLEHRQEGQPLRSSVAVEPTRAEAWSRSPGLFPQAATSALRPQTHDAMAMIRPIGVTVGAPPQARASSQSANIVPVASPPSTRSIQAQAVVSETAAFEWPTEASDVLPPDAGVRIRRAMEDATSRAGAVRLHIEWHGDSASVWVGIDREAAATLPGLIANLGEALARQGLRLRHVVCNGRTQVAPGRTPGSHPREIFAAITDVGIDATTPIDIIFESES